jgi:two-component system, response regulator
MKILMTDDDSDDRLLALLAFKKLNLAHSLDFVENGEELMEYLLVRVNSNRELPDLILLDLNMPKMDGREALRLIKGNAKLSHLDIVIFSTSASEKDKLYSKDMGARKYIQKPSNRDELIWIFKRICEELEEKPGWRYSVAKSPRAPLANK